MILVEAMVDSLLTIQGRKHLKTCFLSSQVSSSEFGNLHSVELVPNGENILVTNSNRQQFVSLYVDHLLVKSVERQFRAFSRGFHKVGIDTENCGLSFFSKPICARVISYFRV